MPNAVRTRRRGRRSGARSAAAAASVALVAVAVLVACVGAPERSPLPSTPPGTPASPTASEPPTPSGPPPVLLPSGGVEVVAQGLQAPWSILRLPGGGVLVSERDTANIVEVLGDGSLRVAATVPGVVPGGEGGLMGLALRPTDGDDDGPAYVYAYFTAASDNRIVRMPLTGAPGSLGLGAPEDVLTGIPKAGNHDGGRIAFGPDGFLYATAGDAGNRDAAQDPGSLSGKILRMTPEGQAAPGNPFGNLTWSYGHRNPQGIAWDANGDLWAAEFGQNTWDELNRIEPGANYGWPVVEGRAGDSRFVDPVQQWSTSEASPSGLAIVGDTLFLAALRGQRLWTIAPATAGGALTATPWFTGELGRLRDVTAGPDGELWFISNNTDGRGSPSDGDDRLYRVRLAPAG
ncbi:PQQ-dependent sugar dehydrogenase [Agromyces mariniharenae]|uniref:PQQ-dependent sugar dehydrogenase n=1 Tax=Agromyces mariniharenae TaxID=2604423 RepID=A0A5S4VA81_9MICO|nr:PQQ-dependent sugar dehydrogenase [Agromyces mariniharenae]TYL54241.1 PQQ-dependent sugar dehydrogenase [Agromyces mariniharenae]